MVKSHAEIHTNPRREVARFSESPYVELNNKTHRFVDTMTTIAAGVHDVGCSAAKTAAAVGACPSKLKQASEKACIEPYRGETSKKRARRVFSLSSLLFSSFQRLKSVGVLV
jgi:hypothetical protein